MDIVRKSMALCFVILLGGLLSPTFESSPMLGPNRVFAQDKTCPDVVKSALATANKDCATIARNSACYGNTTLTAEAQPGATNFTFAKPGDVTKLDTLRTIRMGPLDANTDTWGIVVLRVQANLPDTAPGQNVTMLMFGDVGLTDDANGAALVAGAPGATPAATVQAAPPAISAATQAAAGNFKPMQAFYFRTGIGDPACVEAPRDGILIQSPQGSKQKVTLSADGVKLDLGSTVFLQAQAGKEMIVSTLEGSVTVTAFGVSQIVPAGMSARIPLDALLNASGPPLAPQTYNYGAVMALPVKNLPKVVTILVPKPPANAVTGKWNSTLSVSNLSGAGCVDATSKGIVTIVGDPAGDTIWVNYPGGSGVFTKNGSGGFAGTIQGRGTVTSVVVDFVSATHAEGTGKVSGVCSGTMTLVLDKIG